ncbi:MAG TPA: hypothetical protein VHI76_04315 [Solirubrobacterales bacterium]|nr:hypothetical protein [Solirubrobacterales bacterium]
MSWRLTVRHGSNVKREQLGSLDEAIAELQRRAEEIRAEGPLGEVEMFRTYGPEKRVAARIEITGPGRLRRPEAGVDVMGNGRLVPYRGAILRRELEPERGESAYDAVRAALSA